jgi:hypothetical protein
MKSKSVLIALVFVALTAILSAKAQDLTEDINADGTPIPTPDPRLLPKTSVVKDRLLILDIQKAVNCHDWKTLTAYTTDGTVNYFGRPNTTNDYIRRDMQQDAQTFSGSHSTRYTDTFNRVPDESMIRDSITVYTEVQERRGRLHKALTRFSVTYTLNGGVPTIYSLVLKVLGNHPLARSGPKAQPAAIERLLSRDREGGRRGPITLESELTD